MYKPTSWLISIEIAGVGILGIDRMHFRYAGQKDTWDEKKVGRGRGASEIFEPQARYRIHFHE